MTDSDFKRATHEDVVHLNTPFLMWQTQYLYSESDGHALENVEVQPIAVVRYGFDDIEGRPMITFLDAQERECTAQVSEFFLNKTDAENEARYAMEFEAAARAERRQGMRARY